MRSRTQPELLRRIRQLVAEEAAANPVSYNTSQPYQSYERIGLAGRRWSVEKRVAEYGIDQLCHPDRHVLDIGSHCGFLTVECALRCKLAHGVEPTPLLNRVGLLAAEYLGVADRVAFFDCRFEDFEPAMRYDLVLSLAAFHTFDGRERTAAQAYFSKIERLLAPGGQVVYESTSYAKDAGVADYDPASIRASQEALEAIRQHFRVVKVWETTSGSAAWFRQFAIAQKR